jgi:biotin synthase-like enzyme
MMTRSEAIDLFRSDDLIGLGMAADQVRRKLHPDGIVSYIIDRNINYTNFCTEYCSFCAFYRPIGHAEGYLHSKETIFDKIQETIDLGGTGILRRASPRAQNRMVRGPASLHQTAVQHLVPLLLRAGDHEYCEGQRAAALRHAGAIERRRARFPAWRRSRNSGR